MYLCWYDDNPKHSTPQKVADACAAYRARYGAPPNVALLSRDDYADGVDYGVTVKVAGYIRRNNVWVGWENAAS